jgi:environmental stress-induced protein Ves
MVDQTTKVKLILLQLWFIKTEGLAASDAFFGRQKPRIEGNHVLTIEFRGNADFITAPWRNGLGQTTELAREDGEAGFVWRISRAEVAQNGPFSVFPHVDRILLLLSGAGLLFDFGDGNVHRLDSRFDSIRFAGDASVHCDLIGGPCRDLNIMVDRRWGTAQLIKHHDDTKAVCAPVSVFYPLDGTWRVDGQALEPGGLAVARNQLLAPVRLTGSGTLAQVDFSITASNGIPSEISTRAKRGIPP